MSKPFVFKNASIDLLTVDIVSERLRLTSISFAYEQQIFVNFTAEIARYMFPKPAKDIGETQSFIAESLERMRQGHNLQLVILDKNTGEFLGCCGLHGSNNPRKPEFGIWLKKEAHGVAFGKEAVHALYDWARENLEVAYYIYPLDRHNIASRKIPESLGGHIISEYVSQGFAGNKLDIVVYKIPA